MKLMMRSLLRTAVFLMILPFLSASPLLAAAHPFPVYECLLPKVAFWKMVYSQYNTTQGLLHDSWNLSVIYEVIDLEDREVVRGAQEINKKRVERARAKYQEILATLARGNRPSTSEEKRVAALFGPQTAPDEFQRATERIRCQVGQKNRFREGVIRSGAFLDEIKRIFKAEGIPVDLAYLPHVESSFNHTAYSKFGAAGIWQFMESTGKRFMEIGYALDERRDPILSTYAAAKLLKLNYEVLQDWPMAITAYNHGINGMLRAKQAHGNFQEIVWKYDGKSFKFASRNFYCEFLAAMEVAKNYKKYFGELQLNNPQKTHDIVLTSYVPIKDLAAHLNLDMGEIKRLNPALRPPVYEGQKHIPKGYTLRLPLSAGKGGGNLLAGLPKDLLKFDQKKSLIYSIKKGDTITGIAKIHGVKPSDLLRANDLHPKATIHVGQNLKIPSKDAKRERLALVQTPTRTDVKPPLIGRPAPTVPEHQITPAEPLPFEPVPVSLETLNMDKDQWNLPVVTGDLLIQRVTTYQSKPVGVIHVTVEETLGHYAGWLGVPVQEIRKLNNIRKDQPLRLKGKVKIPLNKCSKEEFEEKRFEYHKELQEDFFASYLVTALDTYHIKSGDNIWRLCREVFEIPFWLISKFNPDLDFNKLNASNTLRVPVVQAKDRQATEESI
jgi:membrane-bound lytic murein transglycosylase D